MNLPKAFVMMVVLEQTCPNSFLKVQQQQSSAVASRAELLLTQSLRLLFCRQTNPNSLLRDQQVI